MEINMNTTYTSRLKPQFQNAGVQDVTADFSVAKQGLEILAKENENELKALKNIAQDQSQIEFNRGAAELVDKYGTDFKGLSDAMLNLENDLYGRMKGTHPELAQDLLRQYDAVRLRAVDAAHRKYISDNDKRIKEGTATLLEGYKMALPDDYADFLDNLRKPAEQKDKDIIGQWRNNLDQINLLLNRKDMNGNYIFDKKTREQKKFLQDYMLDGAKNMIDRFVTDNDKAGLQNYYQAHLLAPERYMSETGQDRATYDKVKKYAEDTLKRMDVDAKNLKFKQSVSDALGLIVEDVPQTMAKLREEKIVPSRILDNIEKSNVKFSEIDHSKPVLPTNFLKVADIVARWETTPNDVTAEQQAQTALEASEVLWNVADYADKYGLSERDIETARRMIDLKARNRAYGELMRTFGEVTQGFGRQINNVEKGIERIREGKDSGVKVKSDRSFWDFHNKWADNKEAQVQVELLDSAIRNAEAQAQQAIYSGNLAELPRIQRELQVNAAHIKYKYNFDDNDWIAWEADKDHEFHDKRGGGIYKVKEITPQGDIITETIR